MDSQETANYEQVRQFAMGQGATLFGVADMASYRNALTGLSAGTADRLTRAVSLAFRLSDAILEDLEDGPTDLYFFHYQRVNILLDLCALRVAAHIQSSGWEAIPVPASQIVDWERQRGHVSHKHVAQQAGLGWIGRNNLLVNPDLGARLRLVTILTDMPLRADVPLALDCGECMACLPSCPSGSIKARPEDFDHHGCFAQIRKMVKEARISQNICGLCVKACRGRRLASEGKP